MIETAVPGRALAVYAHPDDPEVGCGGTLARWCAAGAEVHLIIANRGDKGSADPSTDPEALTEHRASEVTAAAAVLGLAGVEYLGYPDGDLDNDAALRERVIEAIRHHRPDALVTADPTAIFFGDSYVNHRDHREVGWAVLDAVAPAAASPLYFPGQGPPHHVPVMLLSGTLEPDVWVDVGRTIDQKVAAVSCHESRLGDDPELVHELLRARTAEAGAKVGVAHAEGYRCLRLA